MTLRAPGQTVAGKFLLKELIARGGMGSVWKAQHVGLKSDVAVKFIDAQVAKRGNALARFEQEAKAAAAIKSPHVVSVLDFGKDEEGHPYLAMELLNGEELGRRLERTSTLSLEEAKALVVQACKALTRAHAAGYVHRDLKPENVFLCEDDEPFSVKILDFGLAKDESSTLQMTGVDELLGTPDFMSPEQARGRVVDLRTDLYSLGVLVFKCLTGRLPYEKTMPLPELLISITQREPALASVYRPDLPAAVITWLGRALQKEPAKRFAAAKEMGDAFADACTTRRMVVNVPRVSTAAEDEAHGEEHTARAPGVAMGEDTTLLARSDDGIGEDHTVRAPSGIAAAPTTQSSPGIVRPPSHPPSHPPSSHPPTKPADPSIGEDVTLRGEEKPELPRIEEKPIVREPGPPSGARAQPVPPSGFRVEKTLPLDADPAAFAAARALPVKKDVSRSPSNPPEAFSIPPAPPRTGMSLTVTIAIAMFVLAVVAVVWWGFHASAEVPVR